MVITLRKHLGEGRALSWQVRCRFGVTSYGRSLPLMHPVTWGLGCLGPLLSPRLKLEGGRPTHLPGARHRRAGAPDTMSRR